MSSEPILVIDDVAKHYHATEALRGVSLTVERGGFLALVGPSGCGKTTLLKIIGGFETPTRGRIIMDGRDMAGVPPSHRSTSIVFQSLALFPHKTVIDNIGFPLKLRGLPRAEIRRRAEEMMGLMHLRPEYAERYPHQLSGGERQRVALARSLVFEPSILLLDEPMSALDAKLRKALQGELKRLHRSLGVTFVHVTHDLEEAMILADRICVLDDGDVVQLGPPAEIYYRPVNRFVAGFIGETNLIEVTVTGRDACGVAIRADLFDDAPVRVPAKAASPEATAGAAVMMIRPERARFLASGEPAEFAVDAAVEEIFTKGPSVQYRLRAQRSETPLTVDLPGTADPPARVGDRVRVGWNAADIHIFPEDAAA